MMLKAEATPGAACFNQPLLSFTSCTRSYFCCWLGLTSPRSLVQGPAGRSGPGTAGVAEGVPAAAGPRPQRCTSGGEKTAGSRGSGSHATVELKLHGGKGSWVRAARKQQICKCSGKTDCVQRGQFSFAILQRGSFYRGVFCLSLFPPQVSDSVREAIS